jgi:hypothetical protein
MDEVVERGWMDEVDDFAQNVNHAQTQGPNL